MVPEYIKEKYGFSADIDIVIPNTTIYELTLDMSYTGVVTAKCEYNGRAFQVKGSVYHPETFRDDYQRKEIERDFVWYVWNHFSLPLQVVPNTVKVNYVVTSAWEDDWLKNCWYEEDYYDGNMDNFIGRVSPNGSCSRITLLCGVTADTKDDAMQQLLAEAETLQQLMHNKAYITFEFYDKNEFSYDDMKKGILNYGEFSLHLIGKAAIFRNMAEDTRNGETPESFVKIYDYTNYSLGWDEEGWDGFEFCDYYVNGEAFKDADEIYFDSERYDKDHLETDVTVLTNYFKYRNLYSEGAVWYPEYRYIGVNLAKMFPKELAQNKNFVVVEPYEQNEEKNADKSVASLEHTAVTIPSIKRGDYLYFKCKEDDLYAIGIAD